MASRHFDDFFSRAERFLSQTERLVIRVAAVISLLILLAKLLLHDVLLFWQN
jgi:hypothetical protein